MYPLVLIVSGEGCSRPTRRVLDVKHYPSWLLSPQDSTPELGEDLWVQTQCLIWEGGEWSSPSCLPLCQPGHREWGGVSLWQHPQPFLTQFAGKILTSLFQDLPAQKFTWAPRNLLQGCLWSCLPLYCRQLFSLRALAAPPGHPAGEQRRALPALQTHGALSLSLSDSVSCSLECFLSHLLKKESFPLRPSQGKSLSFLANSLSLLRFPILKILSRVLQSLGSGRKQENCRLLFCFFCIYLEQRAQSTCLLELKEGKREDCREKRVITDQYLKIFF